MNDERHRPSSIDPGQVRALQRLRCQGSVSVLLRCTDRPDLDSRRLKSGVDEAHRRLVEEVPVGTADAVIERLEQLAASVEFAPGVSVAVFASEETGATFLLDVEIPNRVVVDDTFATRDLMLALHHQPQVEVLTLGQRVSRRFVGRGTHLEEVHDEWFPVLDTSTDGDDGSSGRAIGLDEYARRIERALRSSSDDGEAPLVLVGSPRRLAAVDARPFFAQRPTRRVARQLERAPASQVRTAVAEVVTDLVEGRRSWALDAAREAVGRHRAAVGLREVWEAASYGRVGTLVVERSYRVAARLHPDGVTFARTDQVTEPGVIDDLVDELIELTLAKRGGVVIVDDGDLAHAEHVAAVLRY